MATKSDLEKIIKQLKSERREMIKEIETLKKKVSPSKNNLTRKAMSVIMDKETNHYKLVKVNYDIESEVAKVESIEDIAHNPKSFPLAETNAIKYLVEEVMSLNNLEGDKQ